MSTDEMFDKTNSTVVDLRFSSRLLLVIAIVYTFFVTSWIGDDAQITFRQIWNFIHGEGIVFNIGERVQAFTHPLWFLVLSLVSFLTNELFLTTIFVSIFLSTSAIFLLLKTEYNSMGLDRPTLSPIVLLLFSWAFVDYATSGLENSLSYVLTGLMIYHFSLRDWQKRLKSIYVILALLVINRFDNGILFLPLAIYLYFETEGPKSFFWSVFPGLLLLLSWFVFSTIYFGSPLPNTYFAKLSNDSFSSEVLARGINYYLVMWKDLTTLLIIGAGLTVSFMSKSRVLLSLSVGIIAYLVYIVYIGGDFMLGRFFSVISFLSVGQIILAFSNIYKFSQTFKERFSTISVACALIFGLFNNYPFFWHFFQDFEIRQIDNGIYDERAIYSSSSGLFSPQNIPSWPKVRLLNKETPTKYAVVCPFLGSISINNTSTHIIDLCGLADPLISRIPPYKIGNWTIGHNYRKLPTDYGEFLIGNKESITDTNLLPLFDDVMLVSRADLFSFARMGAIWRLNSGYHSEMDMTSYRDTETYIPSSERVEHVQLNEWSDDLGKELPAELYDSWGDEDESIRSFSNSIKFTVQNPQSFGELELILDSNHIYDIYINDKLIENYQKSDELQFNNVKIDSTYLISLETPLIVDSVQIETKEIIYSNVPWRDFQYVRSLKFN